MPTLYEYVNTGNDNGKSYYGNYWFAATFTPSIAHTITSVKLLLWRENSPGTVTVGIRATSGGNPTGADLCSGTTNGNTLPSGYGNQVWREISLGDGYDLSANTTYAIVVRIAANTPNKIGWCYKNLGVPGNMRYSSNSGVDWSISDYGDFMFEDWGEPLPVVAPTVTTQAVSSIGTTTATGNGNITDTGGENCSKRGVCWNTTGNPTVADSKSEETDSFGTGAFTRPMTGLTPGQHYYVKAYAYNSAGYGYGSQVEFTASQLLQPNAIPSAEAFGALTVVPGAVSVLPTAIGSLEAFGSAKLNLKLILTGIASAEAFGTPIVISGLTIYPSAIPSDEAFGSLVIAGPLIVPGIASQEAFGSPTVTPGGVIVAPTGISSEELFGLPKLNVFVTPSGIVTSEALGTAKLNLKLILSGIASAEAFGTPTVKMILVIRPSGIASVELFGTPLLIVILAGGDGMKLPTTKGQVSIPSKEVSI